MSGFDRAARRRAQRQRRPYPPRGAAERSIEGAVYVQGRDLGPGVFGVGVVSDPAGVVLSFANGPGKRHDAVEIALTAESSVAMGRALIDYGTYQLQAPRRERAAMN